VESVCLVKGFSFCDKSLADNKKVETEVRKWLRRESEDLYAAGFYALVKRWNKFINVGKGYVEKQLFFQVTISYVLRFISICDLFTDSSSYFWRA
jgi:hypothetical protein